MSFVNQHSTFTFIAPSEFNKDINKETRSNMNPGQNINFPMTSCPCSEIQYSLSLIKHGK